MEVIYQNNNGGEKTMKKKRSRGMHVIKVVLYMLRRNKRRKSLNTAGFWRRLMDSIHPMTTSTNITMMPPPPQLQPPPVADDGHGDRAEEHLSEVEDVFTAVGSSSSSSSAPRSQYGSAGCLSEMDIHGDHDDDNDDDDDDDDDGYAGYDDGGDEMIDVKAEEFIMRFYAQMRRQNQDYNMKRYNANRTALEGHA